MLQDRSILGRHWQSISDICGVRLDPAQPQLKLKHMLDTRLTRFREDIGELLTAAAKEGEIENRLQRPRDDFEHQESTVGTIESRGEVLLKSGKTGNLMAGIEVAPSAGRTGRGPRGWPRCRSASRSGCRCST